MKTTEFCGNILYKITANYYEVITIVINDF